MTTTRKVFDLTKRGNVVKLTGNGTRQKTFGASFQHRNSEKKLNTFGSTKYKCRCTLRYTVKISNVAKSIQL